MAENETLFGIEIGDPFKLLDVLDAAEQSLDGTLKKLTSLKKQGSLAKNIGDPKEVEKINKQIAELNTEISNVTTAIEKSKKGLGQWVPEDKVKTISKAALEAQQELSDLNTSIDNAVKKQQSLDQAKQARDAPFVEGLQVVSALSGQLTPVFQNFKEIGINANVSSKNVLGFNTALIDTRIPLHEITAGVADFATNLENNYKKWQSNGKQLQQWGSSLDGIGKQLSSLGGGEGGGATKIFGQLGKTLQFAGKAAGTLAKYAGVIGAVIDGLKLGFDVYDRLTGKSAKQIAERIEVLKKDIETTKELNSLIREGSVERLEQMRQERADALADAQAELDSYLDQAQQNTGMFNQILTVVDNTVTHSGRVYGAMGDEIKEATAAVEDAQREFDALNREGLKETIARVEELNNIAKQAEEVFSDLSEREDELFNARLDIYNKELDFEQDLAELESDRRNEIANLTEDRNQEDISRTQDHLNELATMDRDFNKEISDLRTEHLEDLASTEQSYLKEIGQMRTDLEKDLARMNTDFRKEEAESAEQYKLDEIESQEDFQKTLTQMQLDFKKDQLKRQKDLNNELFMAELDNDALRYFTLVNDAAISEKEAQADYNESVSEETQSFKEDAADRKKEYEKERQERRENLAEERAEAKKAFQEEMDEKRKQHDEEIQAAKDAFAERLAQEKYLHDEQLANLSQAFEDQNKVIERQRQREDAELEERFTQRRDELDSNFQQELSYFEERERVLQEYTDNLRALESETKTLTDEAQTGFFTEGSQNTVMDDLGFEIGRLANVIETGGKLSEEEEARLQTLRDLQDRFVNWNGTAEIPDDQIAILQSVIENSANRQAVDYQRSQSDLLNYTQAERSTRNLVNQMGDNVAGQVGSRQQNTLSSQGLEQTSLGLMTQSQYNAQVAEIRREQEERSRVDLRAMQEQAQDANRINVQRFSEEERIFQQNTDARNNDLEGYFYGQGELTSEHYNEQTNVLSGSYAQETSMREGFIDDQLSASATQYQDALGLTEQFSEDENELRLATNENQLDAASEFGDDLLDKTEDSYGRATNTISRTVLKSNGEMATQIVTVWAKATQIVATNIQKTLSSIKMPSPSSMGSSNYSSGNNNTGASGSMSYSQKAKMERNGALFAAKGAFIDRPTSVIAGEGKRPEIIFPFDESKGIPDEILAKMGKGASQLMSSQIKDTLPQNNITALIKAISSLKTGGHTMNIGDIDLSGGGVTRQELNDKLELLMQTMVDVVQKKTSATL